MKKLIIFIAILTMNNVFAQNKYFVLFKDKANSPYSVNNPLSFLSNKAIQRRNKQGISITERDFPPNWSYIGNLTNLGATVIYKSRWFNGVLIEASSSILPQIMALPFVKGLEGNGDIRNASVPVNFEKSNKFTSFESAGYGFSNSQVTMLKGDVMHNAGFRGEGMLIGVLDDGFDRANTLPCFQHLYNDSRVLATYDFVGNEMNVYNDGSHGTNVLSCMAAYEEDTLIGLAHKAKYVLLRTENGASETKLEEVNWLIGAEYADSIGVDIINSSLGYSTFDNAAQNYTYADMNGDRAISTRAADFAAQAGIVVVVAAGNEGNDTWHYITAPSDADSVLCVGAVTPAGIQTSFSSFGPSADQRVKPDLAAQGSLVVVARPQGGYGYSAGTSFASPLTAGLVAGFWQANPHLTNMQVIDCLRRSASQAANPNFTLGYGIPNFVAAQALVQVTPCKTAPLCVPSVFRVR